MNGNGNVNAITNIQTNAKANTDANVNVIEKTANMNMQVHTQQGTLKSTWGWERKRSAHSHAKGSSNRNAMQRKCLAIRLIGISYTLKQQLMNTQ